MENFRKLRHNKYHGISVYFYENGRAELLNVPIDTVLNKWVSLTKDP